MRVTIVCEITWFYPIEFALSQGQTTENAYYGHAYFRLTNYLACIRALIFQKVNMLNAVLCIEYIYPETITFSLIKVALHIVDEVLLQTEVKKTKTKW